MPRRGNDGSLQKDSSLRGLGSGVIMDEKGYILTNYHVVRKADEILVALQDGRRFTADIVGLDAETDLAVLKISAGHLPTAIARLDSQPRVGDIVLAIGNPYNLGQTITQGIISATGRNGLSSGYQDFLQTDAAINKGNSGGALIDTDGRLIGINTAAYQVGGESGRGINFAIPIQLAYKVMQKLIESGRVIRGAIGFSGQPVSVNPVKAQVLGLPTLAGVLITDIDPQGAAAQANLMPNDVVIKYNKETIPSGGPAVWMLLDRVAETQPGTSVVLTIIRNGVQKKVNVVVDEKPNLKQPTH